MPTPKAVVTQAELRRCLKAAREAGFDEARVEINKPDGTRITVIAGCAGSEADDIDAMIDKVANAPTP